MNPLYFSLREIEEMEEDVQDSNLHPDTHKNLLHILSVLKRELR